MKPKPFSVVQTQTLLLDVDERQVRSIKFFNLKRLNKCQCGLVTTAFALLMWIEAHGIEVTTAAISGTSLASNHTLRSPGMSLCRRSLIVRLQ
jgi:hypothetical protein